MTRRESCTERLLAETLGNRLIVDDLGLIHWYEPRNSSDSRPWTNSHLTRPLARDLEILAGPTWPEMFLLAHRVGMTPRRSPARTPGDWAALAPTSASPYWGFRAVAGERGLAPTVALGVQREAGRIERRQVRRASPAECLTWAARWGVLGNICVRFRNGTWVKCGEVGRETEVRL